MAMITNPSPLIPGQDSELWVYSLRLDSTTALNAQLQPYDPVRNILVGGLAQQTPVAIDLQDPAQSAALALINTLIIELRTITGIADGVFQTFVVNPPDINGVVTADALFLYTSSDNSYGTAGGYGRPFRIKNLMASLTADTTLMAAYQSVIALLNSQINPGS